MPAIAPAPPAVVGPRRCHRLRVRGGEVELGTRTWIMGILNATPDSFSDGGPFQEAGPAIERGLALFEEAERRQGAAQQLANTLGCLDGMGSASEAQLHGCFLALRLLLDDASALYAAARTAQRHSR